MKIVNFQYNTELIFSSPASEHSFLLRIVPQSDDRQCIKKISWHVEPSAVVWRASGNFGNEALAGRIAAAHDYFSFGIQGTAEISSECSTVCHEPDRILLYPTELTQADGKLMDFYNRLNASASAEGLEKLQRVQYFSRCVHDHLRYERGVTVNSTTAAEAFDMGAGVCQDYAHILLALLRLDGIPCRYVAGLASDYGETHAWVEAWLAGRYHGIDPTRDTLINEGYLALSRGRDFEDCSIERGIFKDACRGTQTIKLSMEFSQ